MNKKKLALIIIVVFCVADIVFQFFRYLLVTSTREKEGLQRSKSALVVGYNMQRQSVTKSHIKIPTKLYVTQKHLPLPEKTLESMPLFLNAEELPHSIREKQPQVTSQYIITATKETQELFVYDLKKREIFWKTTLTSDVVRNSLAASAKWGKIYFRTKVGLNSINFDGSGLQLVRFDIQDYIKNELKFDPDEVSLACQSAADGINELSSAPYTFFSCSTGNHYGKHRDVVGHLFAAKLNKLTGRYIEPLQFKVFKTSIRSEDPNTGFSSGIWNNGMGPTLTPNNKLLIAVGNGPSYPLQNNFGCGIVKIDGDSLLPEGYYSQQQPHFQECYSLNHEVGSSGVSYLNGVASVLGKDGFLRLFNPTRMPKEDPQKWRESQITKYNFGSPLLLEQKNQLAVLAHANNIDKKDVPKYHFFSTQDYVDKLELKKSLYNSIEKGSCVGWIRKKGSNKDRFRMFFSGRYTQDLVLVKNDSKVISKLRQYENPKRTQARIAIKTPYVEIIPKPIIGYSISKVPHHLMSDYKREELSLSELMCSINQNLIAHVADRRFNQPKCGKLTKELTKKNGYILVKKQGQRCGKKPLHGFRRLFKYSHKSFPKTIPNSWFVARYSIDNDLGLRQEWKTEINDGTIMGHTNISAMKTKSSGLIATTLQQDGYMNKSVLKLFRLNDGELVASVPFDGHVHFSTPVWVDNKIIIATKNDGLKIFEIDRENFSNYYFKKSYLFGWNKNEEKNL